MRRARPAHGIRYWLSCLVLLTGCEPDRDAGPQEPFSAQARPRNPDHFILGNGSEIPMPYEVVRSLAVSTGASGMAGYEFQDWLRPTGAITVEQTRIGRTRYRIGLDGLVPGGFYTAWLVRVRGSARGDKRDLALGSPYDGPPRKVIGSNAMPADTAGHAEQDVDLPATYIDPAGTRYFNVEFWDEVHVAFHADNRAYGFLPGPNHWTQVVLPIRPNDGSALAELSPVGTAAFAGSSPNSFANVRATAVNAGIAGAVTYSELQWASARGRVTINHAELGTTRELYVLITADGLVPGGTYSAWFVSDEGQACPAGEVVSGLAPQVRGLFANQLQVDEQGRGELRAIMTPESACADNRRLGRVIDWDRIEVDFHADGQLAGLRRGRQSYVQLSVPTPDPFGER